MKETLESLRNALSLVQFEGSSELVNNIKQWLREMEPVKYACLGCEYCYPAVAMNIFRQAFPDAGFRVLNCAYEVREQTWPPVAGEYFAFCDGTHCPIAVSTLASVELAEKLAGIRPEELCIAGKTETENIGIDKIIKNTITNPAIRVLLLVGQDPVGHYSGQTLIALQKNGVDENMRVVGSPGKHPILRNVTLKEIEAFRKQVHVEDMIGCEDEKEIVKKIKDLSQEVNASCGCQECLEEAGFSTVLDVPVIQAQEPDKIKMDKAGYFVIIPQPEKKIITVEHYSYDNRLLRIIEGKDARSLYWTIIKNGWLTQLTHAGYLGKELMKAELSLKLGFKYVQDGQ